MALIKYARQMILPTAVTTRRPDRDACGHQTDTPYKNESKAARYTGAKIRGDSRT